MNRTSVRGCITDLDGAGAGKAQGNTYVCVPPPLIPLQRVAAANPEAWNSGYGRVVPQRAIKRRSSSLAMLLKVDAQPCDCAIGVVREIGAQKPARGGVASTAVAANVNTRRGR